MTMIPTFWGHSPLSGEFPGASTNNRCDSYVVKQFWVGELILEYGGKAIERVVQ